MTFSKLAADVALLGYEGSLEDCAPLITATNLALRELYSSRPVSKTVRFAARGIKPILYCKERTCNQGEIAEFKIEGVAYSVRIHGSCNYMVKNGEHFVVNTVSTGREAVVFKDFIAPGSTISFWGELSFTIYDFSVYDRVFSSNKDDLPDGGPTVTYDLRKLYGDFLTFSLPPVDVYGNVLKNCRLYDGKLEIDSTYTGEIILSYRRLPDYCDGTEDQEIDIPPELLHLFPILVASYVHLNEDSAKANYMRNIYEGGLEILGLQSYNEVDPSYLIADGWA